MENSIACAIEFRARTADSSTTRNLMKLVNKRRYCLTQNIQIELSMSRANQTWASLDIKALLENRV